MDFIDIPTEQTTAATDFLPALVAVWCAASVARLRPRNRWKANLWASIFVLLAVAAFFGAIVHGLKMSSAALLQTLLANLAQASRAINFTLVWQFDHRGTFHLIQMISLPFMVIAVKKTLCADPVITA